MDAIHVLVSLSIFALKEDDGVRDVEMKLRAGIEPFERHALRYDEWFERNRAVYEAELLAVKELLPREGRGVEIGVGSGRFGSPLGVRVGIEPSGELRRMARKRGIEVVAGVAERLPLRDSSFDYALMVTVLCFVEEPERAVEEVWRILKRRGVFVVGFIDRESPVGRIYERRKNESVFYRAAHFLSSEEILDLMKRKGFCDFKIVQTIFRPPWEVTELEPIKEGYGEGSFVVIRASKS